MGFNTERPQTVQEMIDALKAQQTKRAEGHKAVLESIKKSQTDAQAQSVLESSTAQTKEQMVQEQWLENAKAARRRSLAVEESTVGKLSILEEAKKTVMNKVLFEMVYDAYWLDSDVKESTVQEAYNAYKEILGVVESTCGSSKTKDVDKTKFMKAVETVVEEACKKAADRILQEAKETGNPDIEFNFTSEEESELDQKLADLGRDEIVNLVKDKVLSVVQDEREQGKQKAEMLKQLNPPEEDEMGENSEDTGEGDVAEGSDLSGEGVPVTEAVVEAVFTAAILGTILVCTVLSVKDKIELKKCLKVYEKMCKPAVKMSQLKPTLYEIDKAHRATDKELSGIKKFFNKNSNRAKIWKNEKGEEICAAILYTTHDVSGGASISSDGISPTINVTTTANYSYYVYPKFKKDELYLTAFMAYSDNFESKNSTAFVLDMKKAYPEEVKNMKVKLIGKSLEAAEADPENTPADGIDVIEDEGNSSTLMEFVSDKFCDRDSVQKLLLNSGADCTSTEALLLGAQNEKDPVKAVSMFDEYKKALLSSKVNIMLADSDEFSHEVKKAATNAVESGITLCESCISKKKDEMNTPKKTATLESLKLEAQMKAINASSGATLFESFMMANTKAARDVAASEGLSIKPDDTVNAALIESILQYTVLETLNTLKVYDFTSADVVKLKNMNKAFVRK